MTMLAQFSATGGAVANYIEDVFSTYLYTGNGSTQTITNNIDLSTKGGLVWIKGRSVAGSNTLYDTARGVQKQIFTDSTSGTFPTSPASGTAELYAFNTNGFSLGADDGTNTNTNAQTFASWTFRKQPKFFDVVTFTTNGSTNQRVSHNLGSVPGFIICKSYDNFGDWDCYHRSLGRGAWINLNNTNASSAAANVWGTSDPTTTDFGVSSLLLPSGRQYIAYLFAHNAGGFGLTGSDNVISCGSFTASGAGAATVNLGYEPQWVLMKPSSSTGGAWLIFDNMRGWTVSGDDEYLRPNTSAAAGSYDYGEPTATGFNLKNGAGGLDYIYIAIRRGPMKVPTDATKVFSPILSSATTGTQLTTGFRVDSQIIGFAPGGVSFSQSVNDRLRGVSTNGTASGNVLGTASTAAEGALGSISQYWSNTGFQFPPYFSGQSSVFWSFQRAPSFFDQVCFTGDGTLTPINHNLTVVPELVITKKRSSSGSWYASQYLTAPTYGLFNTTDGFSSQGTSYPVTATTFVPTSNTAGYTHVSYLFASCPGVSKVGSYTGTGTTQQINCGFTAGSRFVLIKRMDSAGDWYVWDSARGIVSGNDPYLLLNSTAAEVTTTDYIDPYSAGFELSSTAPAALNASGGTYIFLAIA